MLYYSVPLDALNTTYTRHLMTSESPFYSNHTSTPLFFISVSITIVLLYIPLITSIPSVYREDTGITHHHRPWARYSSRFPARCICCLPCLFDRPEEQNRGLLLSSHGFAGTFLSFTSLLVLHSFPSPPCCALLSSPLLFSSLSLPPLTFSYPSLLSSLCSPP